MSGPVLGSDEVHLWWASVAAARPHLDRLLAVLGDDERQRAARIRIAGARLQFIAARALARLLVEAYTDTLASEVEFSYGGRGKPRLARPRPTPDLHLNLAHSGDTGVAAFARAPLGVDVEALRPVPSADRLARRFFSDREQRWLAGLPEAERGGGFLAVWTRKEAVLKAIGAGIAMPLREVEVDPEGGRLVRIADDTTGWSLLGTSLPGPAVCTVAVRGAGWRLVVRELEWAATLAAAG